MNLEDHIRFMQIIRKNYDKYTSKDGHDAGIQREMLLRYGEHYYAARRLGLGHPNPEYTIALNWYIQKEKVEGL